MVKFYWQERVWTCGPAALRIALANIGIEKDEKYFTKLLRTTLSRGTSNKNFIKAVKKLNVKMINGKGDLRMLRKLRNDKWQIIVNYFSNSQKGGHYAVVKKIKGNKIHLSDPAFGPNISFNKKYFNKMWYSGFDKDVKWFVAFRKK